MILKVQYDSAVPTTSAIHKYGFPQEGEVLTFLAYSDAMKARVLELIAQGQKLTISVYNGKQKDGEWYELPVKTPA